MDSHVNLAQCVDLETEDSPQQEIVIRKITEKFWQACIELVNTLEQRYRVCATETP